MPSKSVQSADGDGDGDNIVVFVAVALGEAVRNGSGPELEEGDDISMYLRKIIG
jgi:hypothetical protein